MGWGKNQYELVKIRIKKPCDGYYLRWWYNGWHYWFFLPGTISMQTEGEKYFTLGTQQIRMGSGQITLEQVQAIRTILNSREVYIYTDSGWGNLRLDRESVVVYDNMVNGYEIEFTAIVGSKSISKTTGYTPVTDIPTVPPADWVPPCGEIIIGTQIWMICNYDGNYPGSKVYDNDEANRAIYGGLYTANMVRSSGFCPSGWHVPTLDEWNTLIAFVGGLAGAGGELKEAGVTHWNAPNTGAVDSYGFKAFGSGYASIDPISGFLTFSAINERSYFWTQTSSYGLAVWSALMAYDSAAITLVDIDAMTYSPVRLIKDLPFSMPSEITIGTQTWKTTNYDENFVGSLPPNGDALNVADYGRLYTQTMIALLSPPAGWHFPTQAEWDILFTTIGGLIGNAGKLKEAGTAHWNAPNTGATNLELFYARAAGNYAGGLYNDFLDRARWWASDLSGGSGQQITLIINDNDIYETGGLVPGANWLSLRLIKT